MNGVLPHAFRETSRKRLSANPGGYLYTSKAGELLEFATFDEYLESGAD